MHKKLVHRSVAAASSIVVGMTLSAHAAISGNLATTSVSYGPAITLQSINTGFGNAPGGNDSGGGSELDAAYGTISGGNLDLFLAGNFESNGNHLNLFVDGGSAGQAVLNAPATANLQSMNGSVFSPGFLATYAYDMNDYAGTLYNEEYTYAGPAALAGGYVGSVPETAVGIAPAATPGGGGYPPYAVIALDNLNASTMGAAGAPTNPAAMAATTTGFEISIPLTQIGYAGGNIEVLADINGGADGYLSNQFLPGLATGTGNVGGGGPYTGVSAGAFNLAATPGEYFTVAVPEPASIAAIGTTAMLLGLRRRRV